MRIPPRDLNRIILQQVTENPETHDQGIWDCGTRKCVAGWACHFSRIPIRDGVVPASEVPEWLALKLGEMTVNVYDEPPAYRVKDVAQELLGIGSEDAEELFYDASNEEAVRFLEKLVNA